MHSRPTAVILSLGMLLEKMDTNGFIMKLLAQAKQENPEFIFTPALQAQAFQLSEHFNLGKVFPDDFEAGIRAVLGVQQITTEAFWDEWNAMLTVGAVDEKIAVLREASEHHSALFYLTSDTNAAHLKKIESGFNEKGVGFESKEDSIVIAGQYPLNASFILHASRHDLLKNVVTQMREKAFNQPQEIVLMYGDPENIAHPTSKAKAQAELAALSSWCAENNVRIVLHKNDLSETLMKLFHPAVEAEMTSSMSFPFTGL